MKPFIISLLLSMSWPVLADTCMVSSDISFCQNARTGEMRTVIHFNRESNDRVERQDRTHRFNQMYYGN